MYERDASVHMCVRACVCVSTIFDPDQETWIRGSLKVVEVVGGDS